MGVRIIDGGADGAAFYCSTSGFAFGPVFEDAYEAEEFLQWLPEDPRKYKDWELEEKLVEFHDYKEELRKEEEAESVTYQSELIEGDVGDAHS